MAAAEVRRLEALLAEKTQRNYRRAVSASESARTAMREPLGRNEADVLESYQKLLKRQQVEKEEGKRKEDCREKKNEIKIAIGDLSFCFLLPFRVLDLP